jgi:hypothetical protein
MVVLTAAQEQKLILEVTRLIDYKADARRILNEAMGVKKDID